MKTYASVVCLIALASHISVRPARAAGTETLNGDQRPIHAAIATAADNYGHLLAQTGGNPLTPRQRTIIGVAAAIGFGVGSSVYYFQNRPLEGDDEPGYVIASGFFCAVIAGAVAWIVVAGPERADERKLVVPRPRRKST